TPLVRALCNAITIGMVVWTFALPHFPEPHEHRGTGFELYLAAFLFHWLLLSTVSALRLWRAGRGQPSVARVRMRLLAAAAAGLTIAIFLLAAMGDATQGGVAATQA